METQLTVTVTLPVTGTLTAASLAKALRAQADVLDGDTEETSEVSVRGIKSAAKKTTKTVDEDEEESVEELEADALDEEEEETEETEEEEEEAPVKKSSSVTLKTLSSAFKNYAAKNTREKALKLLKKNFDVTSLKDLDESDYKKALKLVS